MQCKVEHGRLTLTNLETFQPFLRAELIYLAELGSYNDLVIHFVS